MLKAPVQFFILPLLPLAWLWFVLIDHLHVEWALNPQYSYGMVVPFLCLYLLWQRSRGARGGGQGTEDRGQRSEVGGQGAGGREQWSQRRRLSHRKSRGGFPFSIFQVLVALCALCYVPTRLIEEGNPDWRLVSWLLAIEVIGLTLLTIYFAFGSRVLAWFAFPICYFFVAVPWPTLIEGPLIQSLTRLDANAAAEMLGWIAVPAIPHGNVIEVASGGVGVDEACSGIRSFQASLMISLFLGELYRLGIARRLWLVFGGFTMSFGFNVLRTFVLTYIAASKGASAMPAWHDPTGVTILVVCFVCLWIMAEWLGKKRKDPSSEAGSAKTIFSALEFRQSAFETVPKLGIVLLTWLVLTELGIEWWYRSHEANLQPAAQWVVDWPVKNSAFAEVPLTDDTRQILRYDEGSSTTWQENSLMWQAIFLRWKPGRTAIHLAQNHTPTVCLAAAGDQLKSISTQEWFDVNGLRMPFSIDELMSTPGPVFVFYCLWNDRANAQGFETMSLSYGSRLAPVLAGLRNPGQRSLEIAVTGLDTPEEARSELGRELQKLVRYQKSSL